MTKERVRFKVLFLDDRSKRIHSAIDKFKGDDLTIVTNVTECLRFLSSDNWDYVFLDHDLGGREFCNIDDPTCGMAIVHYITKTGWPWERPKPTFIIHSSNAFAAHEMRCVLESNAFHVVIKRWTYD
jgi:hypothetical protein